MAGHYRRAGMRPVFLGTVPDRVGEAGRIGGLDYAFVEKNWQALLRFCIERDARLVHAVSGLGYAFAEALEFTNIRFVYGILYYREVLGHSTGETYFTPDGAPIPRPEFGYVLSRADAIYANSTHTRDFVEQAHGFRCPLIYSVPADRGPQ
jgi:hypothetical protein